MNTAHQPETLFRIIVEELLPEIQHLDSNTLKRLVDSRLIPQKQQFYFSGEEKESNFAREIFPNMRDYYSLAGTLVLFAQVMLQSKDRNRVDILQQHTLKSSLSGFLERLSRNLRSNPLPAPAENDFLGKVFQALLHPVTRKRLAVFYTKPIIAKFVVGFVTDHSLGSILDPACGTGIFLIASFQRFKDNNPSIPPSTLAKFIHGIEISPIASLCAETNLRLQHETFSTDLVPVQQGDAFHVNVNPASRVNFLITNPPFTRGERLSSQYKSFLHSFFSSQLSPTREGKGQYCARNMPLHGYFLLDMDRFLRPGGRFGVVLPASTLHLAYLRGVRNYFLAHYALEYVITSDVEPFSEDSDLKEIIIIGHLREGNEPEKKDTTYATLFIPLTLQNYDEMAEILRHSDVEFQLDKLIRINHVKHNEMREGIADWSAFFPSETNIGIEEQLQASGKIGRVRDLEGGSIEAFRGFRQDFAKYWAVPNTCWILKEAQSNYVRIQNTGDDKIQLTLPASTWHKGLSRPEFYPRPLIETGFSYILRESKNNNDEEGIIKYLAWVEQQLGKNTPSNTKFCQQLRQIGAQFHFSGRIAFCHRIDVTTSKIICFLAPEPVQLSQNWFSIRGLDPLTEELLTAWFNSTLFIATYMQHRRAQRGPYGQTAMREFREYVIPQFDKIDSNQESRVIDQFLAFNKSLEFDFPICEQISHCLSHDTPRKEFDLAVLEALQILPSQREKQKEFLARIYRALGENFEKVRHQRKLRGT